MINKYGGAIPETYGVPVEEIQEGIRNGVRKVNIDTDNTSLSLPLCEAAMADPANFDPRHFNKPARKYEAGLPRPLSAVLGRRQRQQDPAADHQLLRRPLLQGCP